MPTTDKTWNEWSRKVLEELIQLTTKYDQLQKGIDEKYKQLQQDVLDRCSEIEKKLDHINKVLDGNNGHLGIRLRLDRLEQTNVADLDIKLDRLESKIPTDLGLRLDRLEGDEKRRSWIVRTTLVAAIGSVVAAIFEWFHK